MPAVVVGRNVVNSGHHATQQMVAADYEPQLLARIQRQPDREQVDVHFGDLSGGKLLDAVEAVDRHGVGRARLIEMPYGHAEATGGPLVLQYRRALSCSRLHLRSMIGYVELFELLAVGIQL